MKMEGNGGPNGPGPATLPCAPAVFSHAFSHVFSTPHIHYPRLFLILFIHPIPSRIFLLPPSSLLHSLRCVSYGLWPRPPPALPPVQVHFGAPISVGRWRRKWNRGRGAAVVESPVENGGAVPSLGLFPPFGSAPSRAGWTHHVAVMISTIKRGAGFMAGSVLMQMNEPHLHIVAPSAIDRIP